MSDLKYQNSYPQKQCLNSTEKCTENNYCPKCFFFFLQKNIIGDKNLWTISIGGETKILRAYSINKQTVDWKSQKITFEVTIEDSSSIVNNEIGFELHDLIDSANSSSSACSASSVCSTLEDCENISTPECPIIPESPLEVGNSVSPPRSDIHCDACDKTFSDIASKRRHNQMVHEKMQRSYCALCDKSYIKRNLLLKHYRNQHFSCKGTLEKRCRICDKLYVDIYTLQQHFDTEHSKKPFFCKEHGKYFAHKKNLLDHLKKHKTKVPPQYQSQEGNTIWTELIRGLSSEDA